jgi:hypothetical protein
MKMLPTEDVYSIKTIQCQHILILIFNNVCSTIFLMTFNQHFIIMTFLIESTLD